MRSLIAGIVALVAVFAASDTAEARPFVSVGIGLPNVGVVVAPAPHVVYRPACPGPNYVWVDSHWRNDGWGRRVWVAGHWMPRPAPVVYAPAPRARVVVVGRGGRRF